ncbi:hypothetical protein SDC9_63078 [bioreactor metagenome]|uniref:Uncharacterized protein n=1 Tax=bioreactor metagenome TaxID=1076179 RepID=A0A644XL60_9ZZZZ
MAELSLGDQHAGDKGAERQRQAGGFGDPCQAQGDQQQVEHEQLFAVPARHQVEPPTHQALAAGQQDGDQRGGLEHLQRQRPDQRIGVGAERGDQDQQRHHGQILEQQNAHHAASVLGFQLGALGHHLHDNGGAAHHQRARQRHGRLPAHVPHAAHVARQQHQTDKRQQHGDHHLHQAQAEYELAHGAQLGQAEFKPDGEHQKHHAELAQVAHALRVARQRQRVGPDQHPCGQVAQHGRLLECATHNDGQNGSKQIEQGEGQ